MKTLVGLTTKQVCKHVPSAGFVWQHSTQKRYSSALYDYRPVALTSITFKCTEKIILKQLRSEPNKHQDPLQCANHKNRNTEDVILTLLHKLYKHLDRPQTFATRVLFVDFLSTFSTMQPHLIKKQLVMEVNLTVISWSYSFLTEAPAGQGR